MADPLFLDEGLPIINVSGGRPLNGLVVPVWARFFRSIAKQFNSLITEVGTIGINRFPLASQPALGTADAGYTAFVSDYGHLVRWDGALWEFAPGDVGNGFIRSYAVAPQEVGWALCNGGSTTRLVVGGVTLTTAAFTTPDLTGSPAYLKTGAAYSGTIAGSSGSTDSATDTFTSDASANVTFITYQGGGSIADFNLQNHVHAGTTDGHSHGLSGVDVTHATVLPYFRR